MSSSFFVQPSRPPRTWPPAARRGRALVESCMAIMVLATAGALLLLTASTSAHLVDTVRMQALAAQYTAAALASATRNGCGGIDGSTVAMSRMQVSAVPSARGTVPGLSVWSVWRRAPLAGGSHGRTHRDSTSTAVWCEP